MAGTFAYGNPSGHNSVMPHRNVSFRQSCVIVVRRLVFRFAGRFYPDEKLVPFVMFA